MKRPLMWFCIVLILICTIKYYACERATLTVTDTADAVTLQGRVAHIEYKYGQTILYLSNITFYGDSAKRISNQNSIGVICYVNSGCECKLGQQVAVQGCLSLPQNSKNVGGFDAVTYYAALGYDYIMYDAKIRAYGTTYDIVTDILYRFKGYSEMQLQHYLQAENAGIMTALLLGEKGNIDSDTKELYRMVGIYHILAISGLHISMIGGGFYKFLKGFRLPVIIAVFISAILIVMYGIMIGMPPSALRAIVMFVFGLLAPVLCRSHDKLTSLACAAAGLIFFEPALIAYSGFQLSFLAVLGIILLYPTFLPLREYHMHFMDGLWVSFAITYFTLPVVMQSYYEVPIYSLLANFCVLPFVPMLLCLGFIIIFAGGLWAFPAEVAAWLIERILFFYEKILSVLVALPGSSYITGAPKPYKVIFFYLVLLLVIICVFLRRRKLTIRSLKSENAYANGMQEVYVREQKSIDRVMKQTHLGQGIVMLLLLLLLLVPAGQEDCITFLDVGQGDGICMELEDEVYLIDCGSTSERGIGNYTLLPYLKYRGIREIDGWFLTHPDEDHVSAFAELCMENNMGGIAVKKLFLPAVLQEEFREIADLAKQNNIEIVWLAYGDKLETGEGMLFVLSPVQSGAYADTNAASLVLLLQYNSFTALFMGDAGNVAEEHIRGMGISDITLLKVGHHGSRIEANAKDFIMQMNPKIAVISCERNNVYGHPHREVTERLKMTGSSILITAEHGAITVELSEDGELRVRGMY